MMCERGSSETSRCSCGGIALWAVSTVPTTLAWVSMTPFGVPVVPLVKMISNRSLGTGRGQPATCSAQSAGQAGSGPAARSSTVEVGKWSRPASRGSGESRPVPMASRRASAFAAIRSTASGAIRRSSGTTTTPARIAPK